MWIHQRTGENTAISAPLWTWLIGSMVIIGVLAQVLNAVWPLLIVGAALFGLCWLAEAHRHRRHAQDPMDRCRLCQRDVRRLAAREQMEIEREEARRRLKAEAENAARLRAKYGKATPNMTGSKSPSRSSSQVLERLAQRFRERD